MTTVVVARGSEWSSNSLSDGWGDETTDKQVAKLANLVIGQFEYLAEKAGYPVAWLPALSTVLGDVDLDLGDEIENPLDTIREQAFEEVWEAVIDDSTLPYMEKAVAEIFEEK